MSHRQNVEKPECIASNDAVPPTVTTTIAGRGTDVQSFNVTQEVDAHYTPTIPRGETANQAPRSETKYEDIDEVRRTVPQSVLNIIIDPDEYYRIQKEAEESNMQVPPETKYPDGYVIEKVAREQSVVHDLGQENAKSLTWFSNEGYKDNNYALRTGEARVRDDGSVADMPEILGHMENINKAISETTTPPLVLWRKSNPYQDFPGLEQAKVGGLFTQQSHLSTSLSLKATEDFSHPGQITKILFPGGKGGGTYMGKLSAWEDEHEFLLKRNSVYELLEATPKDGYIEYVFRVV